LRGEESSEERGTPEQEKRTKSPLCMRIRTNADLFPSLRANSNSPAPVIVPKAVPPPASGLRKGETPQQYVARTVDLDLGDF
jgi:hypothetical protein